MECDEAIFFHDILTTYVFTMLYDIIFSVNWGGGEQPLEKGTRNNPAQSEGS
jgi:hypothetical protein